MAARVLQSLSKALPSLPASLVQIIKEYHDVMSQLKAVFLVFLRTNVGLTDQYISSAVKATSGSILPPDKAPLKLQLKLGGGLWYYFSVDDCCVYTSVTIPGFGGGGFRNVTLFGNGEQSVPEHAEDAYPPIATMIEALHAESRRAREEARKALSR